MYCLKVLSSIKVYNLALIGKMFCCFKRELVVAKPLICRQFRLFKQIPVRLSGIPVSVDSSSLLIKTYKDCKLRKNISTTIKNDILFVGV